MRLLVCALQPAEEAEVSIWVDQGSRRGCAQSGALCSGASPVACALPELSHPGVQLLLIPHLKDDVRPVLHLAGRKGAVVWVPQVWMYGPPPPPQVWKAVTHLQDKGVEVVRHLETCASPDLLDIRAGCL